MINIDQTPKEGKAYAERKCFFLPAMLTSENKPWFEVYNAAMLELDPDKLPERIVAANEAVRLRLKDIQGDADHHAERQKIEDARYNPNLPSPLLEDLTDATNFL